VTAIRSYEDGDREACRALWRELTQWHRDIYDDQSIHADRDPGDFFDEHLEQAGREHVWVAELDGAVVGFTSLLLDAERPVGELEPLVVAASSRGLGVGRALAEHVVAAARAEGLRRLDVKPAARNAPAIAFFHDVGFDTLGQHELLLYLDPPRDWPVQERVADRDFRA
jgi:GNAT superfamily N-acetyltransferase